MSPRPPFFKDAKLNFAENLLFPACKPSENTLAMIAATEDSRENVTWKELRERVRQCTAALKALGVSPGDRVAGYIANHSNAVVAMLSSTSIGALWTAISPDTGVHAVLDRIQQIEPAVLFADNAAKYNGKIHEMHGKLVEISKQLSEVKTIIVFDIVQDHSFDIKDVLTVNGRAWMYHDFLNLYSSDEKLSFLPLQADHPVYILYSSGTTGKPKCIVHGAIGTLIQHKKEHDLQCNIRPGDRLFYFTTCTWMMWHWLISGLASGATIVLYDGSPFRPLGVDGAGELAMPRLIDELGISHFGTSAKYLSLLEQKNAAPKDVFPMSALRSIYSTGSPLAASTFEYVYRAFGPDINLGSITGGTDIISLFGAPSPLSPVYAGEIQALGLGMAVEAWDFEGKNVTETGEPGDLVCVKPFPCQPVKFWGKDGNEVYQKSYFETFPGIWHHGDFVRFNSKTEGLIMLGRSDGVLKPAGVRFGSSEIYNVLLKHFQQIEDALCIGRRRETDADEVVVLFLKMIPEKRFSKDLAENIKKVVRKELSARHVPSIVDECPEIPITVNGKKYIKFTLSCPDSPLSRKLKANFLPFLSNRIEVAVKQILCGMNVRTSASVANAECLEWYRKWNLEHP